MVLHGTSAAVSLEPEASLRIRSRRDVEIACLSGVLWVTRAGDMRDLFVSAGESLRLAPCALTLVTALEPSSLRAREVPPVTSRRRWLRAPRWWRAAATEAVASRR